jgi:hypothetical protein
LERKPRADKTLESVNATWSPRQRTWLPILPNSALPEGQFRGLGVAHRRAEIGRIRAFFVQVDAGEPLLNARRWAFFIGSSGRNDGKSGCCAEAEFTFLSQCGGIDFHNGVLLRR